MAVVADTAPISAVPVAHPSPERSPAVSTAPTLGAVVGCVMVLAGVVVGVRQLGDNSFLTHLATGRLMLDDGIIRADPYTWTSHGEPWLVQSWLASLMYGSIDATIGAGGIRLLTGILCGALVAGLWLLARPVTGLVARVAIVGGVLGVGAAYWTHRPLMFGLLGILAVMLVLERGWSPRLLAPVMYLWMQTHGSFPLGIALIVLVAAGARLDGAPTRRPLDALRWSMVGLVVAMVVNPYGPKLAAFPVQLLGRDETLSHVEEWASPNFREWFSRLFLLLVFVAVAGLCRTTTWRRALPAAAFVGSALLAQRNVSTAVIVLMPSYVDALSGLGGIRGDERRRIHRPMLGVVLAATVVVGIGSIAGPAYELDRFPEEEVEWLASRGLLDGDVNVAHPDIVGNYIEWAEPGARVFVDDRYELYSPDVFADYLVLNAGSPGWDTVLDDRAVDIVIWQGDSALMELLRGDDRWEIATESEIWSVACRLSTCEP